MARMSDISSRRVYILIKYNINRNSLQDHAKTHWRKTVQPNAYRTRDLAHSLNDRSQTSTPKSMRQFQFLRGRFRDQDWFGYIRRSKDWLLVLDNLDNATVAEGYPPRLRVGGGHVLITTRNPNSLTIPTEGMQIDCAWGRWSENSSASKDATFLWNWHRIKCRRKRNCNRQSSGLSSIDHWTSSCIHTGRTKRSL